MIYDGEVQVTGLKGHYSYWLAKDASDIRRAGRAMFRRLVARGYGRAEITEDGRAIIKTLIDGQIWNTTLIDYAAGGASGYDEIEKRRGAPVLLHPDGTPVLYTSEAIPDLTPEEEALFEAEVQRLRGRLQGHP